MSVAIDIMLERLKTHPEEFVSLLEDIKIDGKWSPLLQSTSLWATPEDIKQLEEAMLQARKLLADQVALQILSGEYYEPPQIKMAYAHPYNTGNLTINTSNRSLWGDSSTAFTTGMSQEYKEEIKRMIAEQKLALARTTSK
jgi:hypothetical protein